MISMLETPNDHSMGEESLADTHLLVSIEVG
jgi:hypothetical protein